MLPALPLPRLLQPLTAVNPPQRVETAAQAPPPGAAQRRHHSALRGRLGVCGPVPLPAFPCRAGGGALRGER